MITFQVEKVKSIYPELLPILKAHAEELSPHKGKYRLYPPMDILFFLEKNKSLFTMTARDEGSLVGYCSFIKSKSLHYAGVINFEVDAFFLLKEYRKGLTGYKLLKEAHEMCKREGATHIIQKCKVSADLSKLFERMGFTKIEYTFMKEV